MSEASQNQRMVTLRCSHEGCPRSRKVQMDESMPEGTHTVKSLCPWHDNGDFGSETYYDKDGKELTQEAM